MPLPGVQTQGGNSRLAYGVEAPPTDLGAAQTDTAPFGTGALDPPEVPVMLSDDVVLDKLKRGYKSAFQKSGPVRFSDRSANPVPVKHGCVQPIGSYFQLEAYEPLVHQLLRSLKNMESNFFPKPNFERHLQLFRLIAAPGMGKTTALVEIWRLLFHTALSELDGQKPVEARLLERIRSSLAEGCMMVFLLDLSQTDMYRKDALEHGLDDDGVLALRMLWASVSASKRWQSYSIFLEAMPPQLRRNISSVVLRFWGAAAGIPPDVKWLAAFEVDEVNAASPQTWPREMFSWFVPLRQRAAQMHRDGSLMCMPVLLSASTVAAASSFEGTSRSKVKDLHLPLLPKERAWSMVREFLGCLPNRPGELPMDCPDKVAQIFDWAGGNIPAESPGA